MTDSVRAAFAGLAATLIALGAFYLANTFVLDLGPHPWLTDLRLTMQAGRRYFALAIVSGPILGAAGGLSRRPANGWMGAGIAALFCLEPLAWLVVEPSGNGFTNHPAVWITEAALGLTGGLLMLGRFASHDRRSDPPRVR